MSTHLSGCGRWLTLMVGSLALYPFQRGETK